MTANCDITRTCTTCKTTHPATTEFFSVQKNGKHGLTATCKKCRVVKSQKWNQDNPDKTRSASRVRYAKYPQKKIDASSKWRAENPEKVKALKYRWIAANIDHYKQQRKQYRLENAESIKANYANWYAANRDKQVALAAARRAANPDKDRANASAWYAANIDRAKQARKKWRIANPDKKLIYSENRRARKQGGNGKLSLDLADKLFKLQRGLCACCGSPLEKFHLDHIVPLSRGGTHEDWNIQLLAPKCNMRKGSKLPHEYAKFIGRLI